MNKLNYGFKTRIKLAPEQAETRVRDELARAGFGVITEIDVAKTMAVKLNVQMRPYRILGACNPPFAYESLKAETDLGLFLPCNVIIYQNEAEETVVAAINPTEAMRGIENPALAKIAQAVSERLQGVIERLGGERDEGRP